jgi:hypothetical protein
MGGDMYKFDDPEFFLSDEEEDTQETMMRLAASRIGVDIDEGDLHGFHLDDETRFF